jgi:pseudouridine synthase
MPERLQKILAAAGIASRRRAEALMLQGRVTVNGRTVSELGTKADPDHDHIKVDGRLVRVSGRKIYLLLNKPRGVITSMTDPQGRPTVADMLNVKGRIFHVGRLDYNSEGLLLLTNDGEFAKIIGSAGERFPKVYHVKVRSAPNDTALRRLRQGIRLSDGTRCACSRIRVLRQENNSWLEVTLTEGKNRQVRRMFEAVGHPVMKLRRTRIGFITDSGLPVGSCRPLNRAEVAEVFRRYRAAAPGSGAERNGTIEEGRPGRHRVQSRRSRGGKIVHRNY